MPRKRKPMGRPSTRTLPPRIDASSPEQLAYRVLNAGRPKGSVSNKLFFCEDCKRQVAFPETLYDNGRCEECHAAA